MKTFLATVVEELVQLDTIQNYTIVLPNKRSGLFLKQEWQKQHKKDGFLPRISTIEDFISSISGYTIMEDEKLWFAIYEKYNSVVKNPDTFEVFIKWIPNLIQDFNDLDHYLINPKSFFHHISAVERIENWQPNDFQSDKKLIQKNIFFWENMSKLYTSFAEFQEQNKTAYKGYVSRKAAENIESYCQKNKTHFIFIGLNALTKSEEKIIQTLLAENQAKIYFDTDNYYLQNPIQEAGHFMRKTQKWNYFSHHKFQFKGDYIKQLSKKIYTIGTPKQIGQAKIAGNIIQKWLKKSVDLNQCAWVLADETLLLPALSSLPPDIEQLNITLGYPLKNHGLHNFILDLLKCYTKNSLAPNCFYYKDLIKFLQHSYSTILFPQKQKILTTIIQQNRIMIYREFIPTADLDAFYDLLKDNSPINITHLILNCLHDLYIAETEIIEKEYIFQFISIWQCLANLLTEYNYIQHIKTLQYFYQQNIYHKQLHFFGEPLKGLQLMGMLETRLLDFKNIIISSMNEGIFPNSKATNSLIPLDVRRAFELPTYKEQDALSAYYFYRLLHRAEQIYLLYNTEQDELGSGEKSRFITQLEWDTHFPHPINPYLIAELPDQNTLKPLVISKTSSLLARITEIYDTGLSPSSIGSYIRNPIQFYIKNVLNINEIDEIKEEMDARILGEIIHQILEEIYKPYINKIILLEDFETFFKVYPILMQTIMTRYYSSSDINRGKNLILKNIVHKLIQSFLEQERALVKSGNELIIKALEVSYSHPFKLSDGSIVKLKGRFDRIDSLNGEIRIVDYKTGKIANLTILNMSTIIANEKKEKEFQLLLYAWLYQKETKIKSLSACIVYFKNFREMYQELKINKPHKDSPQKTNYVKTIDAVVLKEFEYYLDQILLEIKNPNIPFEEKILTEDLTQIMP